MAKRGHHAKASCRLAALFICSCWLQPAAIRYGGTPPPPTADVTVTPGTATVSRGATRAFTAAVSGSDDQAVTWRVNDVRGGDSVRGLISLDGVYIAPTTVPSPATVTITATALADATKSGTARVTIQTGSSVAVVIAGSRLAAAVDVRLPPVHDHGHRDRERSGHGRSTGRRRLRETARSRRPGYITPPPYRYRRRPTTTAGRRRSS
jgi:hypothetical protein